MRTRFLQCVVDTDARSLTRDGTSVHLTPKGFELLALLVSERPRAIPKTELLDSVWSGTFVTDSSLARTVHEIRVAIGDDKEGGAIRTVHGHGYAFVAEARDEPASDTGAGAAVPREAVVWLLAGFKVIPLVDGTHLVGRDPAAAIPLDSPHASWHHARLEVASGSVTLEDLGSKNGTYVNGARQTTPAHLCDGDEIKVGSATLVFKVGGRPVETDTAQPE